MIVFTNSYYILSNSEVSMGITIAYFGVALISLISLGVLIGIEIKDYISERRKRK